MKKKDTQTHSAALLVGENALKADVNQPWEQDNQAWWDWYVTLAENIEEESVELVPVSPIQVADLPSDEDIIEELKTPFPLLKKDRKDFQQNGFVKLKKILTPGAVVRLRQELVRLLGDSFKSSLDGDVRDRFLSLEMAWLNNPLIKAYVLSERIGKICAELLNVDSVRLYHDNILSKEPGCGRTPWHYDDHHFPLATDDVVTAWIPAQPIPVEMGPLSFAKPLNVYEFVKDIEFNKFDTSYDRKISEIFKKRNVAVEDSAFDIGEVSFHHNRSFHTAASNKTVQSRVVLASTYFADGARIVDEPTMVSGDWEKFIPGAGPGDKAASELNPICWQAKE